MADVVDICTKQAAVTEFLTADGSSLIEIRRCLRSTCDYYDDDDDAKDVSSDIILKSLKRTPVTGPAAANEPQQQ